MSDETEYKGYTITIEQDEDVESPREWCNLGTMLCRHRNYNLGDAQINTDEVDLIGDPDYDWPTLDAYLIDRHDMAPGSPILPLYLMDHSGLSMSCGDYGDRWDSGQVGWIFATNNGVKDCGTPPELWAEALTGEVATYSQYLEGDVLSYTAIAPDGEYVGGCCGFYRDDDYSNEEGLSYMMGEARADIDADILQREVHAAAERVRLDMMVDKWASLAAAG